TAGCDAGDAVAGAGDCRHFAVLDDVDAPRISPPRITPCNRVVASGAAARLVVGAEYRIAAVRAVIYDRAQPLDLGTVDHPRFYAGEPVGMEGARDRKSTRLNSS